MRISGERNLFARAVIIKVQPGCEVELTRTFEQEVVPLFRREKDFRGLLAFTVPDGTEALSLSLWDQKPGWGGIWGRSFGALAAVAKVTLAKPSVQVCEVGNPPSSTLGQVTNQGEDAEVTADLRVYRSALRPFNVAPTQAVFGRGFPLVWCFINSFHPWIQEKNGGAE